MPIAKQVSLPLAEWANIDVPLLRIDGGGAYIPIKPLCQELLGTTDDRPQRQRIRHDPILNQLTCYLPVQTPGGTQEMLCLSWLGVGRWIDRLNLENVRETYRARILDIMWAITFAAYEVISGQRTLPSLITIVPSTPLLAAFREDDSKQFLLSLAERIGRMEVANRDVKRILMTLLAPSPEGDICPCCGSILPTSD
jgi:hypothetical protein